MTGAARLAARAAQRAGAGVVWIASSLETADHYRSNLESCIVKTEPWAELLAAGRCSAALIGPGYGVCEQTRKNVLALLASGIPCVLDADALTSFEQHRSALFTDLHDRVILTPHAREYARLFDTTDVQDAAHQAQCTIVLKGQYTQIASPSGELITNTNAPPELATAGSGDVLAGLITGLLAQGMPPFYAAAAAVWLHGQAAQAFGPGLIAEDLNAMLPAVLRGLSYEKSSKII